MHPTVDVRKAFVKYVCLLGTTIRYNHLATKNGTTTSYNNFGPPKISAGCDPGQGLILKNIWKSLQYFFCHDRQIWLVGKKSTDFIIVFLRKTDIVVSLRRFGDCGIRKKFRKSTLI